jgi:hypothetical protein
MLTWPNLNAAVGPTRVPALRHAGWSRQTRALKRLLPPRESQNWYGPRPSLPTYPEILRYSNRPTILELWPIAAVPHIASIALVEARSALARRTIACRQKNEEGSRCGLSQRTNHVVQDASEKANEKSGAEVAVESALREFVRQDGVKPRREQKDPAEIKASIRAGRPIREGRPRRNRNVAIPITQGRAEFRAMSPAKARQERDPTDSAIAGHSALCGSILREFCRTPNRPVDLQTFFRCCPLVTDISGCLA